jgi:hypothetical protein
MNGAVIAFHARHADTSHVRATRKLWLDHLDGCIDCRTALMTNWNGLCEIGNNLRDEHMTSIKNHPDKEESEL